MPWTSDRLWGLSNVELSLNPPNVTPVKMKQKLAIGVLIFQAKIARFPRSPQRAVEMDS